MLGNLVADASIGLFALIVWLHGAQDDALKRVQELLVAQGNLTSAELLLTETYTKLGTPEELSMIIGQKCPATLLKELLTISSRFSRLESMLDLVIVSFAVGIAIETVALLVLL